jgi:hypothetical protein
MLHSGRQAVLHHAAGQLQANALLDFGQTDVLQLGGMAMSMTTDRLANILRLENVRPRSQKKLDAVTREQGREMDKLWRSKKKLNSFEALEMLRFILEGDSPESNLLDQHQRNRLLRRAIEALERTHGTPKLDKATRAAAARRLRSLPS